jgi:hypothetical protein
MRVMRTSRAPEIAGLLSSLLLAGALACAGGGGGGKNAAPADASSVSANDGADESGDAPATMPDAGPVPVDAPLDPPPPDARADVAAADVARVPVDAAVDRAAPADTRVVRDVTAASLDLGFGACTEERLVAQAQAAMDTWARPARTCAPETKEAYSSNAFEGELQIDACLASECGVAGTCARELTWSDPIVVASGVRAVGKHLIASTPMVRQVPRCTIRYTLGAATCLCHVNPSPEMFLPSTFRAELDPSIDAAGALRFHAASSQWSGAVVFLPPDLATCEGTIDAHGVNICTADPASTRESLRAEAVARCDRSTGSLVSLHVVHEALTAHLDSFAGSCP